MSHYYEEDTEDLRGRYYDLQDMYADLHNQYLALQARFGKLVVERNALRFRLDDALDRLQGIE